MHQTGAYNPDTWSYTVTRHSDQYFLTRRDGTEICPITPNIGHKIHALIPQLRDPNFPWQNAVCFDAAKWAVDPHNTSPYPTKYPLGKNTIRRNTPEINIEQAKQRHAILSILGWEMALTPETHHLVATGKMSAYHEAVVLGYDPEVDDFILFDKDGPGPFRIGELRKNSYVQNYHPAPPIEAEGLEAVIGLSRAQIQQHIRHPFQGLVPMRYNNESFYLLPHEFMDLATMPESNRAKMLNVFEAANQFAKKRLYGFFDVTHLTQNTPPQATWLQAA